MRQNRHPDFIGHFRKMLCDHQNVTEIMDKSMSNSVARTLLIMLWYQYVARILPAEGTALTVGELRSGVTGFATIFATGSHRFLLQLRND